MKIEWVEDKFADLAGEDGAFNVAASRDGSKKDSKFLPKTANANTPKKMVPMLRTCHGDLVKAPYCALGK
jgi:hypothetical protein